jgi:hypothetical protein
MHPSSYVLSEKAKEFARLNDNPGLSNSSGLYFGYMEGWKAREEFTPTHNVDSNAPESVRFAMYLQQHYEPCETLGAYRLKGGVSSTLNDIYSIWKQRYVK